MQKGNAIDSRNVKGAGYFLVAQNLFPFLNQPTLIFLWRILSHYCTQSWQEYELRSPSYPSQRRNMEHRTEEFLKLCVNAQLSDFLSPYELQPARLPCPQDFPGKNNGVGCHFLLHGIFSTHGSNVFPTMADSLSPSHLGSPSQTFVVVQLFTQG